MKKTVVIGILGSVLDAGFHQERWQRWRPSVSLCQHEDLVVSRFELMHLPFHKDVARAVAAGARLSRPAHDTDWGGYSGYFADPDGHLWEVAWNPGFPLGPDGALQLPE